MSCLPERLADLALDAPRPAANHGLWDRARTYHRRRRARVAVVAVVTLGLLGGLVALDRRQASAGVQPADPGGPSAIPARLWTPSPWLAGTDDAGPIGGVAVLLPASRGGLLGNRPGVVGVSATTGEYRFLDLPADADRARALAPDGRHVAYWTTGTVAGTPRTVGGQEPTVTGVGVLDTRTDEVVTHRLRTEHGLAPDVLVWGSADTLLLSYGQLALGGDAPAVEQGGSTSRQRILRWNPSGGGAPVDTGLRGTIGAVSRRGDLLLSTSDGFRSTQLGRTSTTALALPGLASVGGGALAPGGERVAYPTGEGQPHDIRVVRADFSGARQESLTIPGERDTVAVLTWIDDGHLLVERRAPGLLRTDLQRVDVATGESQTVVRLAGPGAFDGQLAVDLLDEPFAERPAPPRPWDPRIVTGLGLLVALVGAATAWGWSRRVRI